MLPVSEYLTIELSPRLFVLRHVRICKYMFALAFQFDLIVTHQSSSKNYCKLASQRKISKDQKTLHISLCIRYRTVKVSLEFFVFIWINEKNPLIKRQKTLKVSVILRQYCKSSFSGKFQMALIGVFNGI